MTIEIRELVVRVTVDKKRGGKSQGPPSSADGKRCEIVADCVEKVLEVLRIREER